MNGRLYVLAHESLSEVMWRPSKQCLDYDLLRTQPSPSHLFPGLPTGRRNDETTSTLLALYRAGRKRASTRQCPLSGSCCCKGCCIWCGSLCLGAADKGYHRKMGENRIFPFLYERQRRFLQGTGGQIYPRVHGNRSAISGNHLLAQRATQQEASGTKGIVFVHLG